MSARLTFSWQPGQAVLHNDSITTLHPSLTRPSHLCRKFPFTTQIACMPAPLSHRGRLHSWLPLNCFILNGSLLHRYSSALRGGIFPIRRLQVSSSPKWGDRHQGRISCSICITSTPSLQSSGSPKLVNISATEPPATIMFVLMHQNPTIGGQRPF